MNSANVKQFVRKVSGIDLADTFNPYKDNCAIHDVVSAASARREMLGDLLTAAVKSNVDAIWIGRDLGYRGGRRTGLALTDDVNADAHGARWGVEIPRLTKGTPMSERTASVIWKMLGQISQPIFLWNVFPMHPHVHDEPFTNRAHNAKERKVGIELLEDLIEILAPRRVVAIGNDAEKACGLLSRQVDVCKVRHPSYGGQNEYIAQIKDLYDLVDVDNCVDCCIPSQIEAFA